jgi:S-adenosyl-L-methionine hydrolase (adenosine-forming)
MGAVVGSSGIITLLTDFGEEDPYVGAVKGAILQGFRNATIVDLTHHVRPFAILEAAFLLDSAWRAFPAGTVHLAVVDPGVGTARRAVALTASDHYFMGPDNGLFTFVPDDVPAIVTLPLPAQSSATFHARDVFAPAAARLAAGAALDSLGEAATGVLRLAAAPEKIGEAYRALVLHCDRFGNVITNLPLRSLERLRSANGRTLRPVRTYADAQHGELVALMGSSGRVEFAMRQASAAHLLQVKPMDGVLVT